jgi:hypothetical protein
MKWRRDDYRFCINCKRPDVRVVVESLVDRIRSSLHTSPTAVAIGDYNGDGKREIIGANFFSDDVSVLLNGTPGALGSIKGRIWNDFDSDGVLDAAELGSGGALLLNRFKAVTESATSLTAPRP